MKVPEERSAQIIADMFAQASASDATKTDLIQVEWKPNKTYKWDEFRYNDHRAEFYPFTDTNPPRHREYATWDNLYVSINAAPGQMGMSTASAGVRIKLNGLAQGDLPAHSATVLVTINYTLYIKTGDKHVRAEAAAGCGAMRPLGSDQLIGGSSANWKSINTSFGATRPLQEIFWVDTSGIHAWIFGTIWCFNGDDVIAEQASANATVKSISLTFNQ